MKEIRLTSNFFKIVNVTKARALAAMPTVENAFYEVGKTDRYGCQLVSFYLHRNGYIVETYAKTVYKGDAVANMLDNLTSDRLEVLRYDAFKSRVIDMRRPAYGYIEFLKIAGGEPEVLINELINKRENFDKASEERQALERAKNAAEREAEEAESKAALTAQISHLKSVIERKGLYTINEAWILDIFSYYGVKMHVRTKGQIKNKFKYFNFETDVATFQKGTKVSELAFKAFEALKTAVLNDSSIQPINIRSKKAAIIKAGNKVLALSSLLKFGIDKEQLKNDIKTILAMINAAIIGCIDTLKAIDTTKNNIAIYHLKNGLLDGI